MLLNIEKYWENPSILHVGCEKPRAYFIPFSDESAAIKGIRGSSEYFTTLNGIWSFKYYDSIENVEPGFEISDFDSDGMDKIPVPSNWQMLGYDKPVYSCLDYPFTCDPPYVPNENPAGVYLRDFWIDESENIENYLIFDGVDSCFYVWINGYLAGYSQVSHATSEFNISKYIKKGQNRVAVIVLKWCDGSYLEDQDMWRLSGIFRDVYLLQRSKIHVVDYFIKTQLSDDFAKARIGIEFTVKEIEGSEHKTEEVNTKEEKNKVKATKVNIKLISPDKELIEEKSCVVEEDGIITFDLENPLLWSAEIPTLYGILISCEDEIIYENVGIRNIKVVNGVILFNNQKIKFKGANRHDTHPSLGHYVTLEHMRNDLIIMKQHNINAVRTSHYPNDPRFYSLCDEMGFYVMDEADLEHNATWPYPQSMQPSDDPMWTISYMDRMARMVERDKNRPCIVFWSLGNESKYGNNHIAIGKWTKARDDSRLIHYEGAWEYEKRFDTVNDGKYDTSFLDVVSRMYPDIDWIEKEIVNYEGDSSPFVMCEYSHGMGNGPGDLNDYWSFIEKSEKFAGAWIWEWADHTIKSKVFIDENGKRAYKPLVLCEYCAAVGHGPGDIKDYWDVIDNTDKVSGAWVWEWADHTIRKKHTDGRIVNTYGGDFGDEPNSANYCIDGFVTPDRIPSTGLLELKKVIEPIKTEMIRMNDETMISIKNRNYFAPIIDTKVIWDITCDGVVIEQGEFDCPKVEAGKEEIICIPYSLESCLLNKPYPKGQLYLNVRYLMKKDTNWCKRGHEITFCQFKLHDTSEKSSKFANKMPELLIEKSKNIMKIKGKDFRYEFDMVKGTFSKITKGNWNLIKEPLSFEVFRACTDNDNKARKEWLREGYDKAITHVYKVDLIKEAQNRIVLGVDFSIGAYSHFPFIKAKATWSVFGNGDILMDVKVNVRNDAPYLPRFGLKLEMPVGFEKVEYYGNGPYDSYADMHNLCYKGRFNASVDELFTEYIVPQENGSHNGTEWISIKNIYGIGLMAVADKEISFNASHYSLMDLFNAKHDYELKRRDETILILDYAMSGIGSNSCGPELLEKYRFNEKEFEYHLRLTPFIEELQNIDDLTKHIIV